MKKYLFIFLLLSQVTYAQKVVDVATGEYFTGYLAEGGDVYCVDQRTTTFAPIKIIEGDTNEIISIKGAQYTGVALQSTGNAYEISNGASSRPLVARFNITGVTAIECLYQSFFFLKNDSIYCSTIDNTLNQFIDTGKTPRKLIQPTGKAIAKLFTGGFTGNGNVRLNAVATDSTVWLYGPSNTTPIQISFGGTNKVIDVCLLSGYANFYYCTDGNVYGKLLGWFDHRYLGYSSASQSYVNVRPYWESKGIVFPLKKIKASYSTVHIIDANDNHYSFGGNTNGEIGIGYGKTNWRVDKYNWDFSNNVDMVDITQVPGKWSDVWAGTTIAPYTYVKDMYDSIYATGRNKTFALGNGQSLPPFQGICGSGADYSQAPNYFVEVGFIKVNPITQPITLACSVDTTTARVPQVYVGQDLHVTAKTAVLQAYTHQIQQLTGTITNTGVWSFISGASTPLIVNNSNGQAIVSSLTNGVYIFRYTATNSNAATASRDLTVTVSGVSSNTNYFFPYKFN